MSRSSSSMLLRTVFVMPRDAWNAYRELMNAISSVYDSIPCKFDPESWFPGEGNTTRAKELCNGCPVIEPCRNYGLIDHSSMGIWGGLSERERKRIRYKVANSERFA